MSNWSFSESLAAFAPVIAFSSASVYSMNDEPPADSPADPAPRLEGDDGGHDRIVAALDHLHRVLSPSGGAYWKADAGRQKACLQEWADRLGLLLEPAEILPKLRRGGQEHDYFLDEARDRCVKVTRNGVFGLTPGIELALVPSDQDARRFHLWEATPWAYLDRLRLQNLLTPGLNELEGVIDQGDDLAICMSQPRLELHAVTQPEIDDWFAKLGFSRVANAGFYREEDNLGVFDAHDQNVVRRAPGSEDLIPFDVIPVQPDGGFLQFIEDTLAAGHTLHTERVTRTTSRALS